MLINVENNFPKLLKLFEFESRVLELNAMRLFGKLKCGSLSAERQSTATISLAGTKREP